MFGTGTNLRSGAQWLYNRQELHETETANLSQARYIAQNL